MEIFDKRLRPIMHGKWTTLQNRWAEPSKIFSFTSIFFLSNPPLLFRLADTGCFSGLYTADTWFFRKWGLESRAAVKF